MFILFPSPDRIPDNISAFPSTFYAYFQFVHKKPEWNSKNTENNIAKILQKEFLRLAEVEKLS